MCGGAARLWAHRQAPAGPGGAKGWGGAPLKFRWGSPRHCTAALPGEDFQAQAWNFSVLSEEVQTSETLTWRPGSVLLAALLMMAEIPDQSITQHPSPRMVPPTRSGWRTEDARSFAHTFSYPVASPGLGPSAHC